MLFYERTHRDNNESFKTPTITIALPEEATTSENPLRSAEEDDIFQKIWEQNVVLLRDRQFFDRSYFDFMLNYSRTFSFPPDHGYDQSSEV